MLFSGPSGNWPLHTVFIESGTQCRYPITLVPKPLLEVVAPRPVDSRSGRTASGTIAIEAISAQPHRGDRELSSPALWNRDLHHRPVQRDFRGIRHRSAAGAPVNDTEEGYDYPARVRWSLAQDEVKSYQEAAEFLNFNNIDMVCLQHEYGIFGGPAGSHILHLLRGLKMPVVTTLHTVLREPDPNQLMVMEEIAELSDRLIVMSQLSSQFLQEIFKVPGSKIDMVPHGVPGPAIPRSQFLQRPLWGGREGGSPHFRSALAEQRNRKRNSGFAADSVQTQERGLHRGGCDPSSHSAPRGGQVSRQSAGFGERNGSGIAGDLPQPFRQPRGNGRIHWCRRHLHHALRHEAQVVSGTLAYALGAGKAIISTPYWHAIELLDDRRGALVPFQNPDAIAQKTIELLDTPAIRHAMRKRAYLFAREMVWKRVAQGYMESFSRVRSDRMESPRVQFAARMTPKSLDQLPELKLDHLTRLTDDTGMLQHSIFTIPNRREGYTTDDNARALIFAVLLEQVDKASVRQGRSIDETSALCYSSVPGARLQSSEGQIQELSSLRSPVERTCGIRRLPWTCSVGAGNGSRPIAGSGIARRCWALVRVFFARGAGIQQSAGLGLHAARNSGISHFVSRRSRRAESAIRHSADDCSKCMSRSGGRIGNGLRTLWPTEMRDCRKPCCW